jgi:hypothetical protein
VFWTAMTVTCITEPSPAPNTNMYSEASSQLVSGPRRDSNSSPIVISAVPMIGKIL